MAKLRYYIQSASIPLTQVYPVFDGSFSFERDSKQIFYRHQVDSDFIFELKADYDLLILLEEYLCEEVTMIVEEMCSGTFTEYWTGVFSMFDAKINKTYCKISVKPEVLDDYRCFLEQVKEDQNVFSSGSNITTKSIAGTYEESTCFDLNAGADCDDYYNAFNNPLDSCLANPAEWCLKENRLVASSFDVSSTPPDCDDAPFILEQHTTWHREVITTDCVDGSPVQPPYGTGWTLLSDDCAGSNTSTWWRCPPASSTGELTGPYTRGRTFYAFANKVVSNLACGLTLRSDFFNINPVGDAPDNIAYQYATAYLHRLTVHQKSDIKIKNTVNGSTSISWNIKAQDFFDDLRKMFNVWYIIEDGVLRLEHYSFFTSSVGLYIADSNDVVEIGYDGNNRTKSEKHYWMDDANSAQFESQKIIYGCGEKDDDVRLTLFHTDIAYIENEDNTEKIADEGFVLISNYIYNEQYIIIDNNDPLTWDNILENLHKHGRLFSSGSINGVSQDFLSWIPFKTQSPVKTNLCCSDVFNPSDLVTTTEGHAVVKSAKLNKITGTLEIEPIY